MIKNIWEEFASRYTEYKKYEPFSNDFKEHIDDNEYNGLIIYLKNRHYSWDVKLFMINNLE